MGGFVLVVGPSGAGKDMVIGWAKAELAGDPRFVFPRRLVTRPPSAHEDNTDIAEAAFDAGVQAGAFALHWRAHGLGYAIPGDAIAEAAGRRIVVCNVSRRVIDDARRRLPHVHVVAITAAPDILAERLAARGRREDGNLGTRLSRQVSADVDEVIVNDHDRCVAAGRFINMLLSRIEMQFDIENVAGS